jgi:hypothetical protein
MVQESINKVLAMSGKAAEEASRIWREQEEERKEREKNRFKNGNLILKYKGEWHGWNSHPD